MPPAIFDTAHNMAFRSLGALEPMQQWSAFDVPRELARQGQATRFVTTIWNYHRSKDARGAHTASQLAICRDERDGSLWYRVQKPYPGSSRLTAVAHWAGLRLALDTGVPIIGVLKDVYSNRCALLNVFDIPEGRQQVDGSALWLCLVPRADVGCEIRDIAIDQLTSTRSESNSVPNFADEFDVVVKQASNRTAIQRQARLATAPRFARKIQVTSWAFSRNPDVVAEVLYLANGICDICRKPAPFVKRRDQTPYLEVHHRVQLSCGGEDTVANAIAVCPNCHRASHYG